MEENENDQERGEVRFTNYLYVCPPNVTADIELRVLYELLVERYLREVSHLPLPTMAYVLIERIVLSYITMRERERSGAGYGGPVQEKFFKQNWLNLVQEFNKMVQASDQKKHQKMLENVVSLILSILEDVEDDKLKQMLTTQFVSAFQEAGIS